MATISDFAHQMGAARTSSAGRCVRSPQDGSTQCDAARGSWSYTAQDSVSSESTWRGSIASCRPEPQWPGSSSGAERPRPPQGGSVSSGETVFERPSPRCQIRPRNRPRRPKSPGVCGHNPCLPDTFKNREQQRARVKTPVNAAPRGTVFARVRGCSLVRRPQEGEADEQAVGIGSRAG